MLDTTADDQGSQIAARRQALGLSVRSLAGHAGVDRGVLAKIENGGYTSARPSTLGAIESTLKALETPHSAPGQGRVTLRVRAGDLDVVLEGCVLDLELLEASVLRLAGKLR